MRGAKNIKFWPLSLRLPHSTPHIFQTKRHVNKQKMLVSIYNVSPKCWPSFRNLWPRNGAEIGSVIVTHIMKIQHFPPLPGFTHKGQWTQANYILQSLKIKNLGCYYVATINVASCDMSSWLIGVFNERELTFTFAICYRRSVCLSSVCNVGVPYSAGWNFRHFFRHLVPWPSIDIHGTFYGDRPRGTPQSGGLNARGVAKYSDFCRVECCISETVQDRRYVSINHQ